MKLGLATKRDFRLFWSLNRAQRYYEEAYECDAMRIREGRALRVILGRLDQMSGAFIRVVHGCEILIDKVQEPTEDTYCLKPVYGAAPELLEACQELIDYLDKNPPMGESLYSVQKIRDAVAKSTGGDV